MWAKRLTLHEHQKNFHVCQIKHRWCSCKVCIKVATHWLRSRSSHELPTQRKPWPLPIMTFFFAHSKHLQIAWLMSSWVDIRVGLMFKVILIADEWVRCCWCREEIIHRPKMGCLENYGMSVMPSSQHSPPECHGESGNYRIRAYLSFIQLETLK